MGTIVRQPCVIRMARLATDGSTPAGPTNGFIADGVISGTFTPNYDATDDLLVLTACDEVCVNEPPVPILRSMGVSLTFCGYNPERTELLADATLVLLAAAVKGWAMPAIGPADTTGVSVEIFLRRYVNGVQPLTDELLRLVIPRLTRVQFGERNLDRANMAETFTGIGLENPGWGNGPFNDFTATPTNRIMFSAIEDVLPVAGEGYVIVPAQP